MGENIVFRLCDVSTNNFIAINILLKQKNEIITHSLNLKIAKVGFTSLPASVKKLRHTNSPL